VDLGVGDLVGQQGVDLGDLGRGVAQAAAHDLDGDAAVDQLVRVAKLVDADPGTGGNAVFLLPVVRRVVGQRAALAVDGTRGTAGPCTRPGPGRAGAARRSPGHPAARCGRCRPCRGCGRARRPGAGPGPRRTSRRPARRGRRRRRRSRTAPPAFTGPAGRCDPGRSHARAACHVSGPVACPLHLNKAGRDRPGGGTAQYRTVRSL
jgi:hypothetical protein